jgi:serine/threonine-protein phosphatase 2B catalytic subunit
MTENFTFRQEVVDQYDEEMYELFMDVFDSMPLACIVDDKYLAMHGGISPELGKVEEINSINRFQEVPLEGLMCDLLWADPMKDEKAVKGHYSQN